MKPSFEPLPDGIVGIRPAGDRAILVELTDLGKVLNLQAQLQESPSSGQVDVVAAAGTVLVTADSCVAVSRLAERIALMDLGAPPLIESSLVTIDTVYDGADLDSVAELIGLSRDGLIKAHTGQVWTAAFGGFAPGFAYLVGETAALEVPRRTSPRTAVPAGSVALAGVYSAIYPRKSPGGWQLIGRTAASMWELGRDKPALIRPGDRTQFAPVREVVTTALTRSAAAPPEIERSIQRTTVGLRDLQSRPGMLVVSSGLQSTFQDLGRPGFAHLGVVSSGAMDRGALRRSNQLVGNQPEAASVEVLNGGLKVTAVGDLVVAVTGATVPITIATAEDVSRRATMDSPFALMDHETLTMGSPLLGLRSYLAVRGGFDVAGALGSRSTDTMSGIGPEPLKPGTFLAIGIAPPNSVVGQITFTDADSSDERRQAATVTELRVLLGPRADWFRDQSLSALFRECWTVTSESNRIGLRLDGVPLERVTVGELPTEGAVCGAIQIPPEGLPVVLLADHPVTIGYPVIGVVVSADLDMVAQLPPGSVIRFIRFTES